MSPVWALQKLPALRRSWRPFGIRKMCFVVQNHLGKGTRCAPPLHPPGLGSFRALSPLRSHPTVSPVDPSQGDFALPAPIDQRAAAPLETHSSGYWPPTPASQGVPAPTPRPFSWRRLHRDHGRELSRCPCPGPIPSTKEPSSPLDPLTNPARIGYRQRVGAGPDLLPFYVPAGSRVLWCL